jgi:anti-sigma B factor antagonist
MIISQRTVDDAIVIDLNGRLIMREGAPALREKIRELLAGGAKRLAVNLAGVTYIDSAGTGTLASVWATARKAEVRLKVFAPSPKVMAILKVTRLNSVLDPASDEASALAAL